MFRKKVYQWHRQLSLLIALPLFLWSLSGLFHPIMTNIKPDIATQSLQPKVIDSSKIKLGLQQALQLNQINSFRNFRIVAIDSNWFYQVQQDIHQSPVYISASTGKILKKGDWLYAQWLARQFLEGQKNRKAALPSESVAIASPQDCCDAAAVCVLKQSTGYSVNAATFINAFNQNYKSVNRILPVWEVSFDRKDSIRIFVETTQDRFVLGIDRFRSVYNEWFGLLHTWGWLDKLGNGKWTLEIIGCVLILLAVYFGLYIFFTTTHKSGNGTAIQRNRKWHRLSGIAFSLFTIAFTLSGAMHCLVKFFPDQRDAYYDAHLFKTSEIHFSLDSIRRASGMQVSNIGLVHIGSNDYWRVTGLGAHTKASGKKNPGSSKQMMHPDAPLVQYIHTENLQLLKEGEYRYAGWLASQFSGQPENKIAHSALLTKFEGGYGFANKRLPVIKVDFAGTNPSTYYLETATGRLAARMNQLDRIEAYSFAFLHKHEFMTPLGKTYKDLSTLFWGAAQLLLIGLGLLLFVRVKSRNRRKTAAV